MLVVRSSSDDHTAEEAHRSVQDAAIAAPAAITVNVVTVAHYQCHTRAANRRTTYGASVQRIASIRPAIVRAEKVVEKGLDRGSAKTVIRTPICLEPPPEGLSKPNGFK